MHLYPPQTYQCLPSLNNLRYSNLSNTEKIKLKIMLVFFFNYESKLAKIQLNLSKLKSLKPFAQGKLKVIYRKPNVGRMDMAKI